MIKPPKLTSINNLLHKQRVRLEHTSDIPSIREVLDGKIGQLKRSPRSDIAWRILLMVRFHRVTTRHS
jgi:hypothetical protein